MSPVEDQTDPIMLSAWGEQRTVTSAKDPNVDKFFEKYVQGEQTPEPGAACTGGLAKSAAPYARNEGKQKAVATMKHVGWIAGAAAAVLVAAGGITYAVADGDSGTPAPAADSADAGFARDMAVHHQQAVEMSYIVRDRTEDEEVRRLAYDIAQTQANQRGMLLGWLDLWGLPKVSADPPMAWMGMGNAPSGEDGALMPGMATDTEMESLRR